MTVVEHLTVGRDDDYLHKRGTRVRDRHGDTWRKGTTMWSWEQRNGTGTGRLPLYALHDQYGPLTLLPPQ